MKLGIKRQGEQRTTVFDVIVLEPKIGNFPHH